MTKFMECCAVKKQLPEASPSIHLTCHGSSQGKTSMGVVFNFLNFRIEGMSTCEQCRYSLYAGKNVTSGENLLNFLFKQLLRQSAEKLVQ